MGTYVYCVVPANHVPPPGLAGLDQAAVTLCQIAGLGLWTSSRATAPQPSAEAARTHNDVVQAAITPEITPVPIRFGQWLDREVELAERFGPRADQFKDMIARFAGALEFGLRILDPSHLPEPDPVPATSGTAYLAAIQERLKAQAPAKTLQAQVSAALARHVRAERIDPEQAPGLLSLSHLVANVQTEAYQEAVRDLRAALPELRFLASGPWPPYSFARE